jgi:hypothetical protein
MMWNDMTNREKVMRFVPDEELLFADGFDDAIIGLEFNNYRVVYSKQKMIEILDGEMDFEDIIEHLEFNVWGAYMGCKTPMYIND